MPVTNYYSVGGELLGESTSGARTDYLRDALGSVTGTVDASGHAERSYSYKPYGSDLATSGTGADPAFRRVGSRGYRDTGLAHASHYVRLRDYAKEEGRWTSVDPLADISYMMFLRECINPFIYVRQTPAAYVDPMGLWLEVGNCVHIALPFTLLGVFSLEVGVEACKQCFAPQCCKGEHASECTTVGLYAELSTTKLGGDVLKLLNILRNVGRFRAELELGYSFVFQMLQGALGMGLCQGLASDECKKPENTGEVEACLFFCLAFVKVEGCLVFEFPPPELKFDHSETLGFCGVLSVGVKLEGKYVQCR